jgi:hypothetical protein
MRAHRPSCECSFASALYSTALSDNTTCPTTAEVRCASSACTNTIRSGQRCAHGSPSRHARRRKERLHPVTTARCSQSTEPRHQGGRRHYGHGMRPRAPIPRPDSGALVPQRTTPEVLSQKRARTPRLVCRRGRRASGVTRRGAAIRRYAAGAGQNSKGGGDGVAHGTAPPRMASAPAC